MSKALKGIFVAVSALSAIIALALCAGGVWYFIKLKEVTDLRTFESYQLDFTLYWLQIMPYVFIGVGILGALVAFCGFCGAGSNGCLITNTICSFIVILVMVGAGFGAITVATQDTDEFISKTFVNVVYKIRNNPNSEFQKQFAVIETSLHCCGSEGPRDYTGNGYGLQLPQSCCDKGSDCSPYSLNVRPGCAKVFSTYSKCAFYIGTAGCGLVAVLSIISICLSIALFKRRDTKTIS